MMKRVIFAVDTVSEPMLITVDDENNFKVLNQNPDCIFPNYQDEKAVKEFTDSVEDDSSWEFDSEKYNFECEMNGEDEITFEKFMEDLSVVYETEIDL